MHDIHLPPPRSGDWGAICRHLTNGGSLEHVPWGNDYLPYIKQIMKIHKKPSDVTVTFSPDDYWLKKSDDEWKGEYMLVVKIDRSEKGKDPDEGAPILYLSRTEALRFAEAGFGELLG